MELPSENIEEKHRQNNSRGSEQHARLHEPHLAPLQCMCMLLPPCTHVPPCLLRGAGAPPLASAHVHAAADGRGNPTLAGTERCGYWVVCVRQWSWTNYSLATSQLVLCPCTATTRLLLLCPLLLLLCPQPLPPPPPWPAGGAQASACFPLPALHGPPSRAGETAGLKEEVAQRSRWGVGCCVCVKAWFAGGLGCFQGTACPPAACSLWCWK